MNTDHLADTLQFVAASIPGEYSVKVDAAARQLLDMHRTGQKMADLLNHMIIGQPVSQEEMIAAYDEWDNLL